MGFLSSSTRNNRRPVPAKRDSDNPTAQERSTSPIPKSTTSTRSSTGNNCCRLRSTQLSAPAAYPMRPGLFLLHRGLFFRRHFPSEFAGRKSTRGKVVHSYPGIQHSSPQAAVSPGKSSTVSNESSSLKPAGRNLFSAEARKPPPCRLRPDSAICERAEVKNRIPVQTTRHPCNNSGSLSRIHKRRAKTTGWPQICRRSLRPARLKNRNYNRRKSYT